MNDSLNGILIKPGIFIIIDRFECLSHCSTDPVAQASPPVLGLAYDNQRKVLEKDKLNNLDALLKKADAAKKADDVSETKNSKRVTAGGSIRQRQMRELRQMLKQQEARLSTQKEAEAKKARLRNVGFIIFDNIPLRMRSIQDYLSRMGCPNTVTVKGFGQFVNSALELMNNDKLQHTAVITPGELYDEYQTFANSPAMATAIQKYPELERIPVFIALEPDAAYETPSGIDPRMVISLSQSLQYNQKKIKRILEKLGEED